jgi:hypothetical protein
MATTTFREDYLGRDLVAPTTASVDSMGRVTTSTTDFLGRPLRRVTRPVTGAVTLGQEVQSTAGGTKYTVTIAGTTGAADPTAPAIGATVADGTATYLRTK